MKLIFIANSPPDSHKASGYQTFCQSQSLGEILDLKLYLPNKFYKNKKNYRSTIIKTLEIFKNLSFETNLINFINITDKLWINENLRFTISNFSFAFFSVIRASQENCDVIYTRDFYTLFILSIGKYLKLIKKRVAFESHQYSLVRFFLVRNIEYLITINKIQKELYKHKNCIALHDCVWEENIIKETSKKIIKKTILYAGSCIEGKGINRLIYLADKLPEYTFYIANNQGLTNKKISNRLKRDNIDWVGRLSKKELNHLIDKVEFCILPNETSNKSNFYTSPMKLFEYMSRGKALILSPIPTVIEIFPNCSYINLGKSNKDIEIASKSIKEVDSYSLGKYSLKFIKNFTWRKRAKSIYLFFNHN